MAPRVREGLEWDRDGQSEYVEFVGELVPQSGGCTLVDRSSFADKKIF